MERNYYYFIATLPSISYGDKPPMSSEEFKAECGNHLHPDDMALLEFCCYDPKLAVETVKPTGSDFIDAFLLRERALILNLSFSRGARLKRPAGEDPPQDMPRTAARAKAVFEMDDPLEATISMDQSRWHTLDDMLGIDPFGANNLFTYFLKLQLMERRQLFNAEKGSAAYRGLYDTILNEYNSRA